MSITMAASAPDFFVESVAKTGGRWAKEPNLGPVAVPIESFKEAVNFAKLVMLQSPEKKVRIVEERRTEIFANQ